MASLPHYDGQMGMFDHDPAAAARGREGRGTSRPRLTKRELAELAELLVQRVGVSRDEPSGRGEVERTGTLLTADELAEVLGVPTGWVYRQSREGRIPTVRLGRYYRYRLVAIERWIIEREKAA